MKTDNRNTLCVVDTETTGLIPGYHEVIEIAVVVLDEHLNLTEKIFHKFCKPLHPERFSRKAQKVNGITVAKSLTFDDPFDVREEFENFFQRNVQHKYQFAPMGHNFAFDQAMLKAFFGTYEVSKEESLDFHMEVGDPRSAYEDFFFHRYRDTMINAIYLNDLAEFNGELKVPFPKVSLKYVCNILGIENPKAHSALSDAIATAKCYSKMSSLFLHGSPISFSTANAF
jgi:DNA polymerase III epsilon subunit-like protein